MLGLKLPEGLEFRWHARPEPVRPGARPVPPCPGRAGIPDFVLDHESGDVGPCALATGVSAAKSPSAFWSGAVCARYSNRVYPWVGWPFPWGKASPRPAHGVVAVTHFSPDPMDLHTLPAARIYLLHSSGFPTPTGGTQDEAPRPIGAESAALRASHYRDLLGLMGLTRLHLLLFREDRHYRRFRRFGHAGRQFLALDPYPAGWFRLPVDLTLGGPFGVLRWPLRGSRLWLALEESVLGWVLARMEGVPGDAEPPQGAEFSPLEGLYPASASGHGLGDCVHFPDGMLGFTDRALGTGSVVEGPTAYWNPESRAFTG